MHFVYISDMRILVTGANGFIGRYVCGEAVRCGHDVHALLRPGKAYASYPAADAVFYGSLPYDVPAAAWDGVDCVIHLAASMRGESKAQAAAVTVAGTAYLLSEFKRRNPDGVFVFISTQSARETTPSTYGKSKFAAENLVRESGLQHVIIRPGLVVGGSGAGLFARMRGVVRKFPVLPLLGGGALVQPILVEDLAKAIINSLELDASQNYEFNLGDAQGVTLRELLQTVAQVDNGKNRIEIPVPVVLVKPFVRLFEACGIPFPISTDNLLGLESVERMDVGDAYEKLGITAPAIRELVVKSLHPEVLPQRGVAPLKMLIVGAGKIAIVHALDILHREGMALCGVVDTKPSQFKLFRSIGIRGPFFKNFARALRETTPDGVIICTPPAPRLPLVKQCLEAEIAVLVEKPMALTAESRVAMCELAGQYPHVPVHVGYMAAQHPHLDLVATKIAEHQLGRIYGFRAFALQAHIMSPKPVMWEMRKRSAGGGVVINYAGHLLAIIERVLGAPHAVQSRTWRVHSVDVEDCAEVALAYNGFAGRLVTSWSMPGYERPMYRLQIDCEHGTILFENSCTMLLRHGKAGEVLTQLDCAPSVGYNSAPDYTGGGFAREHKNFARAIVQAKAGEYNAPDVSNANTLPSRTGVTTAEAQRIETLIDNIYNATVGDPEDMAVERYGAAKDADHTMDALVARFDTMATLARGGNA